MKYKLQEMVGKSCTRTVLLLLQLNLKNIEIDEMYSKMWNTRPEICTAIFFLLEDPIVHDIKNINKYTKS